MHMSNGLTRNETKEKKKQLQNKLSIEHSEDEDIGQLWEKYKTQSIFKEATIEITGRKHENQY